MMRYHPDLFPSYILQSLHSPPEILEKVGLGTLKQTDEIVPNSFAAEVEENKKFRGLRERIEKERLTSIRSRRPRSSKPSWKIWRRGGLGEDELVAAEIHLWISW
jgi:hypothetical protein